MKMIKKTDRLYLRELTLHDAFHFYEMNNDIDVIRHTGDVPFLSLKAAEDFLRNYIKHYQIYKMARWAVCLKSTNQMIGWCGLKFHPKDKLVDVGYRFYKSFWNKGYATEATKAALSYGFDTLQLKSIVAHVHRDNHASHKVVLKSGMTFVKDFIYDDQPAKLYLITRSNL